MNMTVILKQVLIFVVVLLHLVPHTEGRIILLLKIAQYKFDAIVFHYQLIIFLYCVLHGNEQNIAIHFISFLLFRFFSIKQMN